MSSPVTIDCEYLQPGFAASYLLVEGDEAAFVETNTAHATPKLLEALAASGRRPEDVRWIVVTHAHLDHAGGASSLMAACPNATLLAHPRAARHLIDPSRLVASAVGVYGEETFRSLYGRIDPIPAARVRAMADDSTLSWGARSFRFLHTRGHANHHLVVHDSATDGVFTGDSFGLRYPMLQKAGLFVLPSTSPTDFDPEAAVDSVGLIARTGSRAFLTHYGELTEVEAAAEQLLRHLAFSARLLQEAVDSDTSGPELDAFCEQALRAHYERSLAAGGVTLDEDEWQLLQLDLQLNAQGIAFTASRRRAAR